MMKNRKITLTLDHGTPTQLSTSVEVPDNYDLDESRVIAAARDILSKTPRLLRKVKGKAQTDGTSKGALGGEMSGEHILAREGSSVDTKATVTA